ncbi:PREDICTED: cyclic [Prunus dulcis]|uniref:PREDICTED: cyclic n=1 Tax=Prunus dulcis TaxID=3755 RepID=A0A5E4FD54_PRUDU|nr:cyclic nucleotide-gated ion channel 1-like [Prunus dulcis]XP_034216297.1 cyclic nucleotide-gated ion channel 1-like [Prunus dulcis]VVA25856.1 PREDICTED: cyclic [Prunus dulcis]
MANGKEETRLAVEEKPAIASGEQHSIQQRTIQHWRKALPFSKSAIEDEGHSSTNTDKTPDQPKSFLQEWWNTIFVVSCVLAVLLDPLFFYIPIIKEDRKCLKLDKRLKAISFALRSLTDLFYIADLMHRILARPKARTTKADEAVPLKRSKSMSMNVLAKAKRILQSYILLDILAVLPVPQVVLSIFSKMRGSRSSKTMKFLNFLVVLQYVPRVLPIYRLCHEHKKAAKKPGIWVKSFFNFFLYILASHVIGALWYFFAIQRETVCWQYACRSEKGCEPNTFSCECDDPSPRNITVLNDLCPIKPSNASFFDFGMFKHAIQSGVLQSTDFPQKFLYCFWWGLLNLSSLGQNLQTSTYAWENLFAVFISIIGLLLFLYLIGNLQTYMQLSTTTSEKLRRKMKMKGLEVELWLSEHGFPNTMKTRIMENVHRKLEENKNVPVEILSVLPQDYLSYVKRCLCLATLRKVPKLKDIEGLEELKGICEHFKPVIYPKDSFIIREGEHLDMILLVTQGTVRSYTTSNGGKKDPTTPKHIKQGDFYGEELISWSSKFSPSTELPISDKNVRSITRVEAFALTAEDLKNHVVFRYWWQFSKGIDLNKLTDSQMEQLRELAVIHSQRAFRRRKRAEKPAALPTKTQSMSVVPIL